MKVAGHARPRRRSGRGLLALVGAFIVGGCETDVWLVQPRELTGEPTLRLTVRLEDEALARALGWEAGVPGAEVWLVREQSTPRQQLVSDSLGQVEVMELTGGRYWVWAERPLTESERGLLGEGEARVFGGGDKIQVSARGLDEPELRLVADRRGSLVLSELAIFRPSVRAPQDGSRYLKVTNDSDEVVYLDGHILGAGFLYPFEGTCCPCALYEPFRTNPLWTRHAVAFPGGGTDHPLPPGESVVIAWQAIDHTEVRPGEGYLDLRGADFQLPGDVQNPGVHAMVDVGPGVPQLGWPAILDLQALPFLSSPVDVDALERGVDFAGFVMVRFPVESVLDLATVMHVINWDFSQYPLCGRQLPASLEQLEGVFGTYPNLEAHLYSLHRKVVPGGGYHQRTRTTMVDFVREPVSFGR